MALPTTFEGVIALLRVSVNRPDLEDSYADFINRAVRDCAVLHSFDQMKKKGTVTIPMGQAGISLLTMDPNWKEPQNERFWTYGAIGGATVVPIPVYSRSELDRLQSAFKPNPYLIYTQDDAAFQLGFLIPEVASAAYVLTVFYFAYPAVVTDMAQGTPLLTFYPNLVITKTLSLIFQSINDPIWEEHEKEWGAEMIRLTGVDVGISQSKPRPDKE